MMTKVLVVLVVSQLVLQCLSSGGHDSGHGGHEAPSAGGHGDAHGGGGHGDAHGGGGHGDAHGGGHGDAHGDGGHGGGHHGPPGPGYSSSPVLGFNLCVLATVVLFRYLF
ncbi:hypothetical protein Btru_033267 [Bulinus truncatus]|nr:hypothetical protein Btru_033267 [Bulinus truncatus]